MRRRHAARALLAGGGTAAALALLLAAPAGAHKPLFAAPGRPATVPDGTTSYAAYARLSCPGDRIELRAPLRAGDVLLAELLVPADGPEGSRAAAAQPRLMVFDPAGRSLRVTPTRSRFDEPFSALSYLRLAGLDGRAGATGVYRIVVRSGEAGRVVVAVGTEERFSAADRRGLPRALSRIRAWAAQPTTRCAR